MILQDKVLWVGGLVIALAIIIGAEASGYCETGQIYRRTGELIYDSCGSRPFFGGVKFVAIWSVAFAAFAALILSLRGRNK
jgi:hypothetical protein